MVEPIPIDELKRLCEASFGDDPTEDGLWEPKEFCDESVSHIARLSQETAEFICAARRWLLPLLDRIERLKGIVELTRRAWLEGEIRCRSGGGRFGEDECDKCPSCLLSQLLHATAEAAEEGATG